MKGRLLHIVPGGLNQTCEWSTDTETFEYLNDRFGPFDLDVCALTVESLKLLLGFLQPLSAQYAPIREGKGNNHRNQNPPYRVEYQVSENPSHC